MSTTLQASSDDGQQIKEIASKMIGMLNTCVESITNIELQLVQHEGMLSQIAQNSEARLSKQNGFFLH